MFKKIVSILLIGLLTGGTVAAAPVYHDDWRHPSYEQGYNNGATGNTNNQPIYNYHPEGQDSPSVADNPLLTFGFFAAFIALLSKVLAI